MSNTSQSKATIAITAALVLLAAFTLGAHHGWTGYDDKPLTLSGTVKEVGYENPHAFVNLETSDQVWRVVLAPPSRMENRGLSREMLKTGMKATVVGYQHKTEKNEMRAERITIGDKTTELR